MAYKVFHMIGLYLILITEDSLSLYLVLILITNLLHVEYHGGQCLAHLFFFYI